MERWKSQSRWTHLLLNGGKLLVPNEDIDLFYHEYVQSPSKLYIIEQKTKRFKFFIDIDSEYKLDPVKLGQEFSKIIDGGTCLIATSDPKFGIHFIWPQLIVDSKQARALRMKLLAEFGQDWSQIIDENVYTGPGLRMLWSYKTTDDSSVYVPFGKLENLEFIPFGQTKTADFLRMFSIRSIYEDEVSPPKKQEQSSDLETFIRINIPHQTQLKVISVTKNGKVVSTTSRYCENVKREHKSNHIWFYIDTVKNTISQRCHDEGCADFKGRQYRLPPRSMSIKTETTFKETQDVFLGSGHDYPGAQHIENTFKARCIASLEIFRDESNNVEKI